MTKPLVDVSGVVQGETDRAYRFTDGIVIVWLPKSQCQWEPNDKIMTMPEWLAIDKDLA